jgi:hypothetical protein
MGRLLLIVVLMVVVITSIILQANYKKTSEVTPELFGNYHNKQARNLANYALDYGIRKLVDEDGISIDRLNYGETEVRQSGQIVTDGVINSISYSAANPEKDQIIVKANVTWNGNEGTPVDFDTSAEFKYFPGDPGGSFGDFFNRAVVTVGRIRIQSNRARIIGGHEQNANFRFQDIFGLTLEDYIRLATLIDGNRPVFTGGVYYIQGDLDAMANHNLGSGIVVVRGNIHLRAGTNFQGIMIGLSHMQIQTPHTDFQGTLIGTGMDSSGESFFLVGNAVILYDPVITRALIDRLLINNGLSLGGGDGGYTQSTDPFYQLVRWIE